MSMGFATEELWFTEAEYGGTPYSNPEGYEKWNPRRFAKNMNTPTLVIHGYVLVFAVVLICDKKWYGL